ncbi:M23 family metallopeptidase [Flavobacteriaceae bacterium]|nr:M23 family metallopeptidase [Flavobacteriaceae bacterium]MDA9041532.1 M23 family metallopeptidase [Flavobacteriaceae bacterium]MDA9276482.1 M23 family metallopeptidase [Flavobacteriaceae bacterium]
MRLFLRILFTTLFISNINFGISQEIDFHTPIDAPFDLSGTFGEFRSRFHTGIDFKSRGVQGQKIFSIEDGYVSRIEVNNYGYGKVIYIDHLNGFTSVYAHLKNFSPELDEYVKSELYKSKRNSIKKFPKKNQLRINKGEVIGYSGNTGRSFGPHLHFEIRDTKSQDAINPLMFNYSYKDDERPIIRGLYIINENNSLVRNSPIRKKVKKINDSTYTVDDFEYNGKIGIGLDIYDIQYKNLYNQNGVYKVELFIDSTLKYSYKMDKIKFSENHYKKIMYDYLSLAQKNKKVLKIYTPRNSDLSFLKNNKFNGIINSDSIRNNSLLVRVSDWNGNSSSIKFNIKANDSISRRSSYNGIEILTNQNYTLNKNSSIIEIGKNTFYDDLLMNISYQSDTLNLGKEKDPFRSSIMIKLPHKISDTLELRQSFVGKIINRKISYISSKKNKSYIYASTSSLGEYIISKDTLKPDIKPINFTNKSNIKVKNTLKLRLKDDLSGIKNYSSYFNGNWALFEYEPKSNMIFHNLSDGIIKDGENELIIKYEDGVGNKGVYQVKVYY